MLECDYIHKIFSEIIVHPVLKQLQAAKSALNMIPSQLYYSHKCCKVYHTYCLGFDVDIDIWHCPKHYCALGKCRGNPHFYCELCHVSICKDCPIKWGKTVGGKYQYFELAMCSEYIGKDPNPSSPNQETIKIICSTCIDFARRCIERGEVSSSVALELFQSEPKSFLNTVQGEDIQESSSRKEFEKNITSKLVEDASISASC